MDTQWKNIASRQQCALPHRCLQDSHLLATTHNCRASRVEFADSEWHLPRGKYCPSDGTQALQMRQCLCTLPLPEQGQQHLIVFFALGAASGMFVRLHRTHSIPDFVPQAWPVQVLQRIGKVLARLRFDPLGSISQHDLLWGFCRFQLPGGIIGQHSEFISWPKCRHRASMSEPMSPLDAHRIQASRRPLQFSLPCLLVARERATILFHQLSRATG